MNETVTIPKRFDPDEKEQSVDVGILPPVDDATFFTAARKLGAMALTPESVKAQRDVGMFVSSHGLMVSRGKIMITQQMAIEDMQHLRDMLATAADPQVRVSSASGLKSFYDYVLDCERVNLKIAEIELTEGRGKRGKNSVSSFRPGAQIDAKAATKHKPQQASDPATEGSGEK